MSSPLDRAVRDLAQAIQESKSNKTRAYDTQAEVIRVEDGIAWVHIPGGVEETPVSLTVNAKAGDQVQVRVGGGQAWMVGNASNPPTDDTKAIEADDKASIAVENANIAKFAATQAEEAAAQAIESAREAKETTDEINAYAETAGKTVAQILNDGETAGTAAQQAKTAADNAMKGLGQVEDVVGTLNWITEHSSVTEDTTPTAGKSYYIKNQDGTFTLVTDVEGKNPAQEGWYELTEAVQNYILSHLALANEGLYVMKDGSAWKVNIADDGIYILDPNNNPVNQMKGNGNVIGYEDETHVDIDYHSLQLTGRGDLTPYFWVSDLRDKDDDYQATIKEVFYGDGYTTEFDVSLSVTEEVSAIDHNNPSNTARRNGYTYVFTAPPARNSLVEIAYKTKSFMAKAYTFGLRENSGFIGALSVAEGLYNSAWGFASHAEGRDTRSHGYCSHSEGRGTLASGEASHAQNKGTITRQDYQTAIGKYNDNQSNNAFEIGNGTGDTTRSNAFEVDWNGNVNASGDVEDGQGNVLADKLDSSGIFDLIYPVGSYYWTSDGNFSPANTFGGTWEKIDEGVALVSAGQTYTVQSGTAKDGGNDEITLTDKQMAHGHIYTRPTVVSGEGGHTHTVNMKYTSNATPTGTGQSQPRANGTSTSSGFASIPANSGTHSHTLTGGGVADLAGASSTREAFDNMPPYKAAYCWHRTA